MHTRQNKEPQNGNSCACEAQEETCFAKGLKLGLLSASVTLWDQPNPERDHSALRFIAGGTSGSGLGTVFIPRVVPGAVCNEKIRSRPSSARRAVSSYCPVAVFSAEGRWFSSAFKRGISSFSRATGTTRG